ncbi:OmpA family protein [Erythrobacter sp. JK5]|uniref:OmpA family protein n=1 Tax=Erythrobacter sp. JK5 TaxID=2829500 RepID=UPI001BA62D5B|nr:OmpA family protein [Erythrobacter sp. JK5]QUL39253.1 OmpA family protein [Erythrobacter sp. JK5]
MTIISNTPRALALAGMLAIPVTGGLYAQQPYPVPDQDDTEVLTTVYGSPPADLSGLAEGPEIEGFISARNGDQVQVTSPGGTTSVFRLSEGTEIRSSGGFLGLSRASLGADQLLNGLPVEVRTVSWGGALVASRIKLKNTDLKTASMIRNGTEQRFGQNEFAIAENAAATEALRGRVGDIDKYNIKGTTNVYFDTGKYNLSAEARNELCSAASQAEAMDNALLLVVGYTDSTGSYEINQELSERRAARVTNYLQQQCGWKPWRMLTPTGMAESDPAADNSTAYGKAQNRRVAVNILVSKSVDGL